MLNLKRAKDHLNIENEFTDDDEYIQSLINVSYDVVNKHINNSIEDVVNENGDIPTPLEHAMLLMIGNLYQNREIASFANATRLPYNYEYLLNFYKNYYN